MPRSLAFYRDLLGFEVVASAPPDAAGDDFGWAWLRHGDDTEIMLNTAFDPDDVRPREDGARRVAHGDTALFIGTPDVDAVHAYLRERGVDVKPPNVTHYGMKQLSVTDPDGFGLCFQCEAR